MLCRAGVAKLILFDNDIVSPGILVRQPYSEADIGKSKSHALRERLAQIDPEVEIVAAVRNVGRASRTREGATAPTS